MRRQFQKREIGKPNYPALAVARRMHRKRIINTLSKPTTQPTKLAEEGELVLFADAKAGENLIQYFIINFSAGDFIQII